MRPPYYHITFNLITLITIFAKSTNYEAPHCVIFSPFVTFGHLNLNNLLSISLLTSVSRAIEVPKFAKHIIRTFVTALKRMFIQGPGWMRVLKEVDCM
jgi:hypothetical protein